MRIARLVAALLAAIALAACSTITTTVVAPSSSVAPTGSTSSLPAASPDAHAIGTACATLGVHLKNLAKELKGLSPVTDAVEGEFAVAARQLDGAVPGLEGTEAASDLADIAEYARMVGAYNGTDIGDLLTLVGAFGDGAKRFNQTYCQIL